MFAIGFKGVEFKGDVGDFFLAFSVKFKDVPCFLLGFNDVGRGMLKSFGEFFMNNSSK